MRTYQSLALLWKQCLLCKLPGRILGIILRSTEHTNKDLWLIWIPFSLPKISFALHLFQYKFFSSSNVKIILNTTSTVRYFQNLQVNSDVLFVSKYVLSELTLNYLFYKLRSHFFSFPLNGQGELNNFHNYFEFWNFKDHLNYISWVWGNEINLPLNSSEVYK